MSSDEEMSSGEELAAMKQDVAALKTSFEAMMLKIDQVLNSNAGIAAEFAGMKTHIDVMKKDLVSEISKVSCKVDQAALTLEKHEQRLSAIEEKCSEDDRRMRRIEERQIDDQARMRRNNLIFYGFKEEADEKAEDCKRKILDSIQPFFPAKKPVLQRAHRLGAVKIGHNVKPRGIIVLFHDYNDIQIVKKERAKLQRTQIFIKDDLPQEIREARKLLSKDLERHRAAGDEAYVAYPARLFVNNQLVRTVRPVAASSRRSASFAEAAGGGVPPPEPPHQPGA